MIYLNQNLFSLDRYSVRESFNLLKIFEERGNKANLIYRELFEIGKFRRLC